MCLSWTSRPVIFWCFFSENAWIYLLYVVLLSGGLLRLYVFRRYSVNVFYSVIVLVVITEEKLKSSVISIPM